MGIMSCTVVIALQINNVQHVLVQHGASGKGRVHSIYHYDESLEKDKLKKQPDKVPMSSM